LLERELRFGPLAAGEVAGQVAFYAAGVGGALAGLGPWSFVIAALAHALIQTFVVLVAWRRAPPLAFSRSELRRLLGLGVPVQTAVALGWLRDAVVPWAGGLVSGVATGGFLQFAWRLGVILSSAEEIVGRIAFPLLARQRDDRADFDRTAAFSARLSLLLSAPLLLWAAAAGPVLIPAVFGEKWTPAVVVFQLVCVGSLARFPVRVVRQALFARGLGRRTLVLAVITFATSVVPAVAFLAVWGLVGAGVGFVLGAGLTAAAAALLGRSVVRLGWRGLSPIVAQSVAAVAAAWAVLLVVPGIAGLALSGAVALVVGAGLALAFQRDDVATIRRLVSPAAGGADAGL
jgi:O-antigen/teichoic acid export membrane protein